MLESVVDELEQIELERNKRKMIVDLVADTLGLGSTFGAIGGCGYLLASVATTALGTFTLPITLAATAGAIALVIQAKTRR